jgi:hypothetical protein
MPQEFDSSDNPEFDAAARRVLDGVKDEPIPRKIVELAEKLERVLEEQLRQAPKDPK